MLIIQVKGNVPPVPEPPTVTITMTPASVITGAVLNFAATGVSEDDLTYQWNLAGVAIAGATLETYARTTVLADNGKAITCTVTDTHAQTGVSAGQTMVVSAPPFPGTHVLQIEKISEAFGIIVTGCGVATNVPGDISPTLVGPPMDVVPFVASWVQISYQSAPNTITTCNISGLISAVPFTSITFKNSTGLITTIPYADVQWSGASQFTLTAAPAMLGAIGTTTEMYITP
jgi:hypothetical protein